MSLLLFETFITPIPRGTAQIYKHSTSRGLSALACNTRRYMI